MNCPECLSESTHVIWTRHRMDSGGDHYLKRRRECKSCNTRFSTFESYELADLESAFRIAAALKILDDFKVALLK